MSRCKSDLTGVCGGPLAELKRECQRVRQQQLENPDHREVQRRRSAAEKLHFMFPISEWNDSIKLMSGMNLADFRCKGTTGRKWFLWVISVHGNMSILLNICPFEKISPASSGGMGTHRLMKQKPLARKPCNLWWNRLMFDITIISTTCGFHQ